MSSEVLVEVSGLGIRIILIIFAVLIAPKLNTFIDRKKEDLEAIIGEKQYDLLMLLTQEAVLYVEKEYADDLKKMGAEKKQRVIEFLKRNGFEDFDEEMIDIAIENTVEDLTELGLINKDKE
jgi:nicotinamide riboside kinase